MEPETFDIGHIEMNLEVQEEIIEEPVSWIDTWHEDTQALAQEVWDQYADNPAEMDEEDYYKLDVLVCDRLDDLLTD